MTLEERLAQDMKSAIVARDVERLGALRLLKAAVGYAAIEKNVKELSDADFIAVVQKEVKKRRDAADQYEKAGRADLAGKERSEIHVLEAYLPPPLSPEELEELVRKAIDETGATSKKQMGAVIKAVQAAAAGRADGSTISATVGRLLP